MKRWQKGMTTILAPGHTLTEFDLVEDPGTEPHKDSGEYCTVGHMDGKGNTLPECTWCNGCKQWIRPENMDEPCLERERVFT